MFALTADIIATILRVKLLSTNNAIFFVAKSPLSPFFALQQTGRDKDIPYPTEPLAIKTNCTWMILGSQLQQMKSQ